MRLTPRNLCVLEGSGTSLSGGGGRRHEDGAGGPLLRPLSLKRRQTSPHVQPQRTHNPAVVRDFHEFSIGENDQSIHKSSGTSNFTFSFNSGLLKNMCMQERYGPNCDAVNYTTMSAEIASCVSGHFSLYTFCILQNTHHYFQESCVIITVLLVRPLPWNSPTDDPLLGQPAALQLAGLPWVCLMSGPA